MICKECGQHRQVNEDKTSSKDLECFVTNSEAIVANRLSADWIDIRNLLRVVRALKREARESTTEPSEAKMKDWYTEWYRNMYEIYNSEWDAFLRDYVFSQDSPFSIEARPARILGSESRDY